MTDGHLTLSKSILSSLLTNPTPCHFLFFFHSIKVGWINEWMLFSQLVAHDLHSLLNKCHMEDKCLYLCDESYIGWILSKPSWFFCSFWKLQARPALECWISGPLNKAANSGLGPEEAITLVLQFINHLWNFFFEPCRQNVMVSLQMKKDPDVFLCTHTYLKGKQIG